MEKPGTASASWRTGAPCQEAGYGIPLCHVAILALGLLLPARAGAGDAGYHFYFYPKLTPSAFRALPRLAQATEPEQPPPQPPVPLEPEPEPERPKPEAPREALLLERGAILLPKGTLQIEPSFEYSHFSSSRVAISGLTIFDAIIIGTLNVDSLKRDILTGYLTARYGLLDRLQFDVRIPYVYRRDEEVLGVGTANQRERTTDNHNIGDIETSLLGQALIGSGAVPDVILRVDATFPTGEDPFGIERERVEGRPGELRPRKPATGTGFYGVGPGVTAVWRSDPVVFFTGARYTFNLSRDVGNGFGNINPGDSLEWLAGFNLAVSERVALNLSFVDKMFWSTTQGGVTVPGSSFNDARLVLGASIGLTANVSLLVSAGIGLTEASPDFQFTVSLPIAFKLF